MHFQNRLDASTYADDEPVGFRLEQKDLPIGDWSYVPDSLVGRMLNLGAAYKLHYLSLIELYGETHLNGTQCLQLSDEIRFLASFINDPALLDAMSTVMTLLENIERNSSLGLEISGP